MGVSRIFSNLENDGVIVRERIHSWQCSFENGILLQLGSVALT